MQVDEGLVGGADQAVLAQSLDSPGQHLQQTYRTKNAFIYFSTLFVDAANMPVALRKYGMVLTKDNG